MVLDGMEILVSNDLRVTKGAWIKSFVERLTVQESRDHSGATNSGSKPDLLTSSEKYKRGVNAWMNSKLRSVLMSGKQQGHASIPASLLLCK